MNYNGFAAWILLLHLHCTFVTATSKVHENLSLAEIKSIFNVDSRDQVPDYDIVNLHHRVRRSADTNEEIRTVHINAFKQKHVLNLRPNKVLAQNVPVFYAEHDPQLDKVVVKPVMENIPDDSVGVPYQDEDAMSAMVVRTDRITGRYVMEGTIGEDLIVRPLPSSVADVLRNHDDLDSFRWRREEEQDINAIRPPDDEAFLDDGLKLLEGDLSFSDQFPLVADDETKSGQHQHVRKPYSSSSQNETLPDGLELLKRKRRSNVINRDMHIVMRSKANGGMGSDSDLLNPDDLNEFLSSQKRTKRSSGKAPSVIYPEILVLVDYDGYLLHDKDNNKIKSYYVSFWNGADLRYKLLSHPRIKLSIAGIIISRSRDAMPYLERNRVGRDAIDSANALTDMGKYLFQERRLPTYDIAVAITKLDMCRRPFEGSKCNRGTAGFAYVGGACVVNKRLKKVNSVAIVEDTGGFSGIIVAAHEVGHLLGAVHDGSPPPTYLGGPGARRCRWEDGYIMSDLRHTEKGFKWSDCSVKQFQHFLNGDTATCLYNLPHEDESLPRILPGKLLSLDQQCRKDRGTSACFKDDRVCAQLFCFDSQSGYCVSYRPAAEGSDCGGGKICLNGRCVYDNENSISDHDLHGTDDSFLMKSTPTTTLAPSTTRTTTRRIPKTTKRPTTLRTTTTTKRPTTRRTTTKRPTTRRTTTTTKRPTTRRTTTTTKRPTTRRTTTTKRPTTRRTTTTKRPTTISTTTTTKRPTTTTPKTTTTTTSTKKPITTLSPTRPTWWNTGRTTRRTTSSISTTSRRTSVSTSTTPKANKNINKNKIDLYDGECRDSVTNITGSLTCREFLRSYGARYCGHRYIRKNCCSARREICKDHL